ncbi:MAG: GNAT family N-acetyltransferase [Flavobacteriales bacterium]|nr:MAG: GNAT family N-acetyltransferase [Flavobacteriales bacterium]
MLTLDLSDFPTLRTERLLLREPRMHDAAALFAMRSDERVMQYIGRRRATTLADAEELLARIDSERHANMSISWAITLNGDDTMIGTIGYYRIKFEHFRGEVGYMLHADHWRKGIMREAVEAVVQCGFERLGFHSIEADTDPLNIGSNALLASCGFTREGLFKESFFWNGCFQDSAVWSRLAPR